MKVLRSTMLLGIPFTRRDILQYSQCYFTTLECLLAHLATNTNV